MIYLGDFNNKKSKERKVINTMIRIYCRGNCKGKDICPECKELMDYVYMRIEKCSFSDSKIYCNNCNIHCYRDDMALRIKKYIGLTVLINWVALISNVVSIFFIGRLLEKVYMKTYLMKDIKLTISIIIISMIIRSICNLLSTKTSTLASVDVKRTLRTKIYGKLLSMGQSYHEDISTSEAVQVSVEGIEQLETYFGGYLPQLFYSLLAPITLFIILSFISFKASIVLLLCVPLIPLSIMAIQKFAKKLLSKYWGTYTNMGDSFLENIQGLTTLKIYERDKEKSDEMDIEAEKFRKITMRVLTMQLNSISIMDLIAFGGAAVGTIIAVLEFKNGNIGLAGAFIIIILSSEFFIPLRLLGSFFHIAMNGMAASEKIFRILDMEIGENGDKFIEDIESIEFKNIDFSYDGKRNIIKDNSFTIEKGQLVSFVGESGSGKSTIAKLIMGINKGYSGNIYINDIELSSIAEKSIMKNITLIKSNNYLFKGSVRDNLKMGNESIKDEDMIKALKKVKLFDFIKGENGLNTLIKEDGANLSGGQRQRLALARGLLKDTDIFIFDEATSNIDMESEKYIMDIVYDLSKTKTVILISHRLVNVINSDRIYVLENGHIKEVGNHNQLIDKKGIYEKLYTEQYNLENFSKTKGEVGYA